MKTKPLFLAFILILAYCNVTGQVGIGTQSPDSTAILDLSSANKGFLVPRLTTSAQVSIKNPAVGLLIFNLDFLKFYYYDGQQWLSLSNNIGDTLHNFGCGDSLFYSGQYYSTVQIGTQCWLRQNLNVGTRINVGSAPLDNGSIEKYCYYDDPTYCNIYGGLYSWNEMMQYSTTEGSQGICPFGWYLPTDAAWTTLTTFLGGDTVAGGKMKEAGFSHWGSPNTGASNESGFTALPGGICEPDGSFGLGSYARFWSSSINFSGYAWDRLLTKANAQITREYFYFSGGLSVRCLNGSEYQPPDPPFNPYPENGSVYQPVDTVLTWDCTDPENSTLVFDIYFDTISTPVLVQSNNSTKSFDPGPLEWVTTYYWKIVARDPGELTTEGPLWSFTTLFAPGAACPGDTTVDYGGKIYHTVQIGAQCWLRENLDIGTWIPDSKGQGDNDTIEKYCYNNIEDSCDVYGGLYQWSEMTQYHTYEGVQGICPDGWYLPTDAEWTTMISFLGGESVAGGKIKEAGLAHWISPNAGATNESGFSALPGGWRNFSAFSGVNEWGFFWGTRKNVGSAWYYFIRYDQMDITKLSTFESLGMSVRCIRAVIDPPPPPVPCPGDTTFEYSGKTYHTVQIGDQCWMAENLDIGTMIPGDSVQKDNGIIEKYCYDDDAAKCSTYGGLYIWDEMMQYTLNDSAQGICPEDWHLPTRGEWWTLINYLGGETVAGGKMKETGTAHWISPNNGATNESVFTGLPGGQWDSYSSGNFNSQGLYGDFWTTTTKYLNEPGYAWSIYLSKSNAGITEDWVTSTSTSGLSVRCIHD